jgi:hypothetical protein
VPPERRSLQLSCCEPGASYYAEGFSPLPGRCFRLVTGTARTARHTAGAGNVAWHIPRPRRPPYRIEACEGQRYHLKLWIGFPDESAAYLPA